MSDSRSGQSISASRSSATVASNPTSSDSLRTPANSTHEKLMKDVTIFHADEFDTTGLTTGKAMIAGASAGVMEHICMFPVDTIKTRMQQRATAEIPNYRHVFHAAAHIAKHEGIRKLYRGITTVAIGAIPSHAVYFATYEACRRALGGNSDGYHAVVSGISGGIATMAHDAVVTPIDVVKQRLQMHNSSYYGVKHAVKRILHEEGARAFYASYPTTVVMNVPFMAVHFAAYDTVKHFLNLSAGHDANHHHFIAGAAAGALGGFVSNPLDVVKTRIQTQGIDGAPRFDSSMQVARSILKEEGSRAFFRGVTARVLYFMPSAAICWTTYEGLKTLLMAH